MNNGYYKRKKTGSKRNSTVNRGYKKTGLFFACLFNFF